MKTIKRATHAYAEAPALDRLNAKLLKLPAKLLKPLAAIRLAAIRILKVIKEFYQLR